MEPADWIEDMEDKGMFLVVDPGETNGIAIFTEDGELNVKMQGEFLHLLEMLQKYSFNRIIVEDYRLRKGKQAQQTGSRFQAVQVIGALKYHSFLHTIPLELANVQAKTLGSMYSGVKPPSDHKKSHEIDAYNIGIYWLVANDIIYPPTLKDI